MSLRVGRVQHAVFIGPEEACCTRPTQIKRIAMVYSSILLLTLLIAQTAPDPPGKRVDLGGGWTIQVVGD